MVGRICLNTSLVIGVVALVTGTLGAVPPAFAGGTVIGTVTYTGKAEVKKISFRSFPNSTFCQKIGTDGHQPDLIEGEFRLLKTVEVGEGGALNAAVVAVTDVEETTYYELHKGTDVLVTFCESRPYTGVVMNQGNFHVENGDRDPDNPKAMKGVFHDAHVFEVEGVAYHTVSVKNDEGVQTTMDILLPEGAHTRTIFNIALPEQGSRSDRRIMLRKENEGSFVRLQCDYHAWEQAFFLPVKNPYHAVTGTDGSFRIENVPAGKHTMIAWHPFVGQIEAEVEVKDGATVTANFQIKK